ncbi:MAG: TIGR03960 family B12-binding radical SAM protein [Candidatus Omnitrophota bacterium]
MLPDDLLSGVQKPGRYIGREWNASRKDFQKASIKFALCFPDLYEVGMSNLGMRIIYGILNNIEDVSCERFFSPETDMERVLTDNRVEIFSLETRKNLKEFDIAGFSLASELNYTNVLNILKLGGIPLKASLRDHTHPLIIAGGPCVLNPEPMHEFFDLFVIGESEDLLLELMDVYRKHGRDYRSAKITKQDFLVLLSGIEGIYVPSLYEVTYNSSGEIEEFKPKIKGIPAKIKKRFLKDLDSGFFPSDWMVPYIQIIHDRVNLEIMRGCPNRCRFCQARSCYFPLRVRNAENVLRLADESCRRTGYEEISLGGLSVSDYPGMEELLRRMVDLLKTRKIGISLPSIKAKAMTGSLPSIIAGIKKTGLTFAPEAGTKRLREAMAKDFDEEHFFKALEDSYSAGYQHVKLYFMIGLPYEEQQDLDGIIDFSHRASELRRKLNKPAAQVNISINTLIPKPHTPLQWFKMDGVESVKHKQDYLRDRPGQSLPAKARGRLKLGFHNRYMSFLEAVLSRGDRRLSEVILSAFDKGAKFDAWVNHFVFETWDSAFKGANIDPDFYLRARPEDEPLPWDFIDVGIDKKVLIAEFRKVSESMKGAIHGC